MSIVIRLLVFWDREGGPGAITFSSPPLLWSYYGREQLLKMENLQQFRELFSTKVEKTKLFISA